MKIFFDVDGVLMSNIHMVRGWIKRWDENIEKDLGIRSDHFQEIFKDWFPKVLTGHLDFEEEMDRWLTEHDYDLKAWQVIDYWHEKDMNLNEALWPAIRKLSQQPEVELYIATNQSHARAKYLWNEAGFKNHFKGIYYSARLGCLKHDGDYFRQIEQELAFDPRAENVLYFDDDPKNIDASSKRGWNAVLFDTADDTLHHPALQKWLARS